MSNVNKRNSTVRRNFSDLPAEILSLIIEKVLTPSDLVRSGGACVSWRSATLANPKHCKLGSLPVLLLPLPPPVDNNEEHENKEQRRLRTTQIVYRFYSLYDKLVHDWPVRVSGSCRGSSHGWLVVTTEVDLNYSVRLFNPFLSANNEIMLPPLTAMELDRSDNVHSSNYIYKAVVSARPSTSNQADVVVVAIHGFNRLSFCKPGDKVWTAFPFNWKPVDDVIYYEGMFYAILQCGTVLSIKVDPRMSLNLPKDIKILIVVPSGFSGKSYIVESSGELLWVMRTIHYSPILKTKYVTAHVKVCKLDQTESASKWVEIKTLNGRMLFLGQNASISLPASAEGKPNCIYFTDDNESASGQIDMGVYNLEDGSFEPLYGMQTATITPNPIWIQPTLE